MTSIFYAVIEYNIYELAPLIIALPSDSPARLLTISRVTIFAITGKIIPTINEMA